MNRLAAITVVSLCGAALNVTQAALPPAKHFGNSGPHALSTDTRTFIGVNNLQMLVSNVGQVAHDPSTFYGRYDGLYFPRGTDKTLIYAAGLWMGAKVNGAPRVAIAEYVTEYVPGPMADGKSQPDQGRFHVYKVGRNDNAKSNADWANWPVIDGAPVVKNYAGEDSLDENGNPVAMVLGDQALFSVYNDADPGAHINRAGSTAPLGIEVQQYVFAYARRGSLGNSIYLTFKIINKGADLLEDCFVSLWADPDVGLFSDDLVGCDTVLSLGYAYNDGPDSKFGDGTPAVGFDFLQGPIVPSPGDSALQGGRWVHGYRNLPMTSFNKYVNGTDPVNSTQTYNYMLGLEPNGDPVLDPDGNSTLFQVAGDPVAGSGWVDVNSGDRRFMMSAGPFTMAPGDTQEVMVAVLVGQGGDPLGSISELKAIDQQVQAVFDLGFSIPFPPPQPTVWYQPLQNRIELIWDSKAEGDVQESAVLGQRFVMEGYNVYQGPSTAGPWRKIVTFDVENDIARIYNDEFDSQIGAIQRVMVQSGDNTGLENHLTITNDPFLGRSLINHRPYYYAVTAYSFDTLNVSEYTVGATVIGHLTEVLESPIEGIEVVPNSVSLELIDTALHIIGGSEGSVYVRILEPAAVPRADYLVTFNDDLSWNLDNTTTLARLLTNQTNTSGNFAYPVLDGFMLQVTGPDPGVKDAEWTGGEPWVSGVDWGGGFYHGGIDMGCNFSFGSSICDPLQLVDVELRFSRTNTQKGYRYLRGVTPSYPYSGFGTVPFTAWDVTSDPPRQLNVCFVEQFQLSSEDSYWLPPDDDPDTGGREYLFILNSDYSDQPLDFYTSRSVFHNGDEFDVLYFWWPVVAAGHSNSELNDGQVLHIALNKPNTTDDQFAFSTYPAGSAEAAAGRTLKGVHPVPNPYFHRTDLEPDQFNRQIQFVNMPPTEATLEIYNLAGEMIRSLRKEQPQDNFINWDVLTESGLPPASGLYIYRVTAPGMAQRVGKLAVFTERERLKQF